MRILTSVVAAAAIGAAAYWTTSAIRGGEEQHAESPAAAAERRAEARAHARAETRAQATTPAPRRWAAPGERPALVVNAPAADREIAEDDFRSQGRARLAKHWDEFRTSQGLTDLQAQQVLGVVWDAQEELARIRELEELADRDAEVIYIPANTDLAKGMMEAELKLAIERNDFDQLNRQKYGIMRAEMRERLKSILTEDQLDFWTFDLGELDSVGDFVVAK